jgi:ElaB/YqjD/DUF883 family membrane-anchored ribosome-binding protein
MADTNTTTGAANRPGSAAGNDELRDQLDTLKTDFADLAETVRGQAKRGLSEAQDRAGEKMEDIEAQIRRNPIQATAIAAGIGFLLGAIMSR